MRKKIIEFFKKNPNYVSGEELSHYLGISRQGLWKHIQELRLAGYEIMAVPHLGYRLTSSHPIMVFRHIRRYTSAPLVASTRMG